MTTDRDLIFVYCLPLKWKGILSPPSEDVVRRSPNQSQIKSLRIGFHFYYASFIFVFIYYWQVTYIYFPGKVTGHSALEYWNNGIVE